MNEKKRKLFNFGKVAYYGKRKIHTVTVEMTVKEVKEGLTLSICGNIWNSKHTDCLCCGQCLDTIKDLLPDNELFAKIYRIWDLYHLNDLHAGTVKQEEALKAKGMNLGNTPYNEICNYLRSIGLYDDNGIEYGKHWNYHPIPEDDVKLIYELLNM